MGPQPGSEFGNYRIDALIGRGGMGSVYLATDQRLGRRVALKLLSSELGTEPTFRDRFIAESRIAASLDNAHIVPIYEAGEVEGQLFIAMRYVQGVDLDARLRREGPLDPVHAVSIIGQIADALDAAHAAGLIHRDVKPGNILLGSSSGGEDHAYLSDFGLTRQAAHGAGLTRTGQLVGTVDYVAPEQIEGGPIDRRVDIYSLGCVLYEAITGAPPYRRDTEVAVLYAHVQSPPPSLHDVRQEVPAALDAVFAKAVAKDPDDRYQTASEFARAAVAAITLDATPAEAGTRGFLFADLRGYTNFVERLGDEAGARLLDSYRVLVREVVARQRGAEVRTEGDSFYVLFPSASRAVTAALEIVAEAARRTTEDLTAPIRVGVGVHAGETAETAEGPVGSAVNLAARICAEAQAGEVLVSDTVRGLTRTRQVAIFEPIGSRRLKGIAEAMPLFRALAPGEAVSAGGRRPPSTPLGLLIDGSRDRRKWAVTGTGVVVVALVGYLALGGFAGLGAAPSPTPSPARTFVAAGGSPTPVATKTPTPTSTPTPQATATPTPVVSPTAQPPTGTRIVFSRQAPLYADPNISHCGGVTDAKLYLVDPGQPSMDAYRLTANTNLFEWHPWWSADGLRITYAGTPQNDNVAKLLETDPAGIEPQTLVARDPGESYTGSRIMPAPDAPEAIFVSGQRIWRASAGTTTPEPIYGHDPAVPSPGPVVLDADWLPDGTILVAVGAPGKDGEVIPGDDVAFRKITDDGSIVGEVPLDVGGRVPLSMTVSRDGKRVAFEALAEDGSDLMVGDLSSGKLTPAVPRDFAGSSPAWSPDSGSLAYQRYTDGLEQIWTVDLASGRRQQVTHLTDAVACTPSWGPATPDLRPAPTAGDLRPFERGVLAAGHYRMESFHPAMELDLPAGWFARRNYVDGFSLRRVGDPITQELDAWRIQVGLAGPCPDAAQVLIGPAPADLVTWFSSRADLNVSDPHAINLADHPGLSFDVTARRRDICAVPGADPAASLFHGGEDLYVIGPEEKIRFMAIDVDGVTVTFEVDSTKTDLDAFVNLVKPILDSFSFPPP